MADPRHRVEREVVHHGNGPGHDTSIPDSRRADSSGKVTRVSTSSGAIQKAGGLYQVSSDSPPVGTFDLELDPPLNLSLLSFDVVSRRLSRYRPETSFQYPAYLP